MSDHLQESVAALVAEGEREGCLNLSRFNEFVAEHELDDDDVRGLYEQLDEREIEVSDDCGRAGEEESTYVNGDLAVATTDALAAVPERSRPLAAPDRRGRGRARRS